MIGTAFEGGTGRIVIDRPGKANALTEAMLRDLTAAFDAMIARGFAGTAFRVTERFGASAVDYQTPSTLKCVVVQSLRS